MDTVLRPNITLTDFRGLIPTEELHAIISAVEKAMAITLEAEGTDLYIPHFRAIYSSCLFPRIWGMLEESFMTNEDWEIKKTAMTFTLIKKGICQFHFYKGRSNAAFKAVSKRQKAIVQGELYADLENLPSVILQHFSDRANSQLLGFHALFFVRGQLAEEFDVMHQTSTHNLALVLDNEVKPNTEEANSLVVRFRPKRRQNNTDSKKLQKEG